MVLVRILGWILIIAAVLGGIAGAALVFTDRISGGFLTAVYIVGPAILLILIGRAMTRAGRRGKDSYADQWTRNGGPK
jgi:cytochrome c biogenesis protein CcdA